MGGLHSVDTSVPPGGALLYIQRPECFSKPSFSEPKPACLSTVPDPTWNTFQQTVATAASNLWTEKSSLAAFLLLPIIPLGVILPRSQGHDVSFISFPLVALFLGLVFGLRFFSISQNEKQDKVIREACSQFASATGVTPVYRTQYTGFCKPKGAHPYRAIAIAPMAPMGVASVSELMSVQVPPGCGPGSTLQVQSPSGQQVQVVVPDGVLAGQTFQAQVPPPVPVVVAGTVVQN